MSLSEKYLRTSDLSTNLLRDFDFGTSETEQGNHPAVSLEPSFNQLIPVRLGDPSDQKHLLGCLPFVLHTIKRPESEPNHSSLFIDCEHAASYDDWERLYWLFP